MQMSRKSLSLWYLACPMSWSGSKRLLHPWRDGRASSRWRVSPSAPRWAEDSSRPYRNIAKGKDKIHTGKVGVEKALSGNEVICGPYRHGGSSEVAPTRSEGQREISLCRMHKDRRSQGNPYRSCKWLPALEYTFKRSFTRQGSSTVVIILSYVAVIWILDNHSEAMQCPVPEHHVINKWLPPNLPERKGKSGFNVVCSLISEASL